ncbi:MAG: GNAT family N-acetyltransferase [Pirellulales bacterium]
MATAIETRPESRPLQSTSSLDFRHVRSAAELHELAESWRALDAHIATPMQTFAWIAACAETFAPLGELDVIIGWEGNDVVAAAALIAAGGKFGGRRELLNYYHVYEPADLAFRDAETLAALANELCEHRRPLFFERVFAASPTVAAIHSAAVGASRVIGRPQAATPWIGLNESWAAPEQKLSSRRRSDYRRACKNAEQIGAVRMESHSPDPDEVDRLLDVAFDVERRSWKGRTGTALADDRAGDFYRRYARSAAGQRQFRVELLHIGGEVAAVQLAVVHQNRYWVLKVGYDPQFQRASPGILLMVESVKAAVAEGLTTYELLGTIEPWIQVWTELERPCVSLRFYPGNWRGAAALAGDLLANARRRMARKENCHR